MTIYMLVGAWMTAIAARLGDIFGRRICILFLLAAGATGSLISASFDSFAMVLVGRGLQGLTVPVLPLCVGLVRELVPQRLVSVSVGLIISAAGIGTLLGLVLGGVIIDNYPWQSIFLASTGMATLAFLAVLIGIPSSPLRRNKQKIDFVGGLLFIPAIGGFLLAISKGNQWGWGSAATLATMALSVLLMALWVRQSLNHPEPLIDVRLFCNRSMLVANLAMGFLALGSLQITQVFSLLLQQPAWTGIGLGVTATLAGLVKLPSNIVALGGGPLSG